MKVLQNKKFKVAIVATFILALLLYVWVLVLNDTVCFTRTNMEPSPEHFRNDTFTRNIGEDLRGDVLAALTRQFNTETGFFDYSLHPDGTVSSSNNAIRQLLGSRILAAESLHDESIAAYHRQNLETILHEWYRSDGEVGYVYFDEKSKLGANAMLLRTLVASPHFEEYKEEAQMLVQGIIALKREDNSFEPWLIEPVYEYDADYLLTFYSGEAILALLEYAERSSDTEVYETSVQIQDFYLDHYVRDLEENYYPAYVPWHTLSLAHLYRATGEKRYADAIFILNDKLLELQDREKFPGRFAREAMPEYGSPHAASDAVYTEGLMYAYEIAGEVGDTEREEQYHDAIVYALYNLASLRYEPEQFNFLNDREMSKRIAGGMQAHVCSRWVRVDTNTHTVDALTKMLEIWPK